MKKEQVRQKRMLIPKKLYSLFLGLSLTIPASQALAGLYGFTEGTPLSPKEKILDMPSPPANIPNYRNLMRDNIDMLVGYAQARKPDFQIILHEGADILYKGLWEYHLSGYKNAFAQGEDKSDPSFLSEDPTQIPEEYQLKNNVNDSFFKKIDAIFFNNLYCTPRRLDKELLKTGIRLGAISQCPNAESYDKAVTLSVKENILFYGFLNISTAFGYIADQPIINENAQNIYTVKEASNISFLLDNSRYKTREELIRDVRKSNYDIVVVDPIFHDGSIFTPEEVNAMKYKKSGQRRLVIARQNITEAFAKDYYWHEEWNKRPPSWIKRASLVNKDGYIVEYWQEEWKKIISQYFRGIVLSRYDGVFLTGINNHHYFESLTPLE